MDYFKTYNYFYNKTERLFETFIKKTLMKSCNEERNFTTTINKINGERYDLNQLKQKKELISISSESFKFFDERFKVYNGDNVVKFILMNECFDAFNDSLIKNKIDYNYNKYVANLAIYESLKCTGNRFRNYDDLYRLMYELNDFKEFSLKEVEGGHKSCGLYDRLFLRCYPESNKRSIEIINKNKDVPVLTKYDKNVLGDIKIYTEKDKVLLLYSVKYALYNQIKISAIEFSRVLLICKIDDLALFQENYKNTTAYKKLSNGLKYSYSKKNDKIEAISKLQNKNERFGLKDINNVFDDMLEKEVLLGK